MKPVNHATFRGIDRYPARFPASERASDRTTASANALSMRWSALGDAGKVVAALAGVEPERPGRQMRNFPVLIRDGLPWRRELAESMVADLAAVMEPGIATLLAVNARGANPRPAAMALWQEYSAARTAILSLLPPSGEMGPARLT